MLVLRDESTRADRRHETSAGAEAQQASTNLIDGCDADLLPCVRDQARESVDILRRRCARMRSFCTRMNCIASANASLASEFFDAGAPVIVP